MERRSLTMQAAKPISRREMLYYLAGGMALLVAMSLLTR
jgi:hypothetical protein